MDERLESEIFEEQLNSLYKPIKQAPKTPESEKENNQALANQNLANQGLANESVKDLEKWAVLSLYRDRLFG